MPPWHININNPALTQLAEFNSESKIEVHMNANTFYVEKCLLYLISKKFQNLFNSNKTISNFNVESGIKSEKSFKILQDLLIKGHFSVDFTNQELCDFIQLLRDIQCDIINNDLSSQITTKSEHINFVIINYQLLKDLISKDHIAKIVFHNAKNEYLDFFKKLTLDEIIKIFENENLIVFDNDQIITTIVALINDRKEATCLLKYIHLEYGSPDAVKEFLKIFEVDWAKNDQKYHNMHNLFKPFLMNTQMHKNDILFPRKYIFDKGYRQCYNTKLSKCSLRIPYVIPLDLIINSPTSDEVNVRLIYRFDSKIYYDITFEKIIPQNQTSYKIYCPFICTNIDVIFSKEIDIWSIEVVRSVRLSSVFPL